MARKYNNFRVGGSPQKVTDDYAVWTNDLLGKVIASKTVIQPGKSTLGHQLVNSDVVYVIVNGRGIMEVVEYMNSKEGHGSAGFFYRPPGKRLSIEPAALCIGKRRTRII